MKKCRFISMASNDKYTPDEVKQKLGIYYRYFNSRGFCHFKYVSIYQFGYVDLTKDYDSAERRQT